MNPLSPIEKDKIISRLFWDVDIAPGNVETLIETHLKHIEDVRSQQFFRKLLTSCDWYTLLKLIPAEKMTMILDDKVVNRLFPRDLQAKYKYARDLLSRLEKHYQ